MGTGLSWGPRKAAGQVLRAAALSKLGRVACEVALAANFPSPRPPGSATASDVSALLEAIIDRCTLVGDDLVPSMTGTPLEGKLPKCLHFEIGNADVAAALKHQDHDLVALSLLVLETELEKGDVNSSPGAGATGASSLLNSPLGDILQNSGVSENAERLFRSTVLLTKGASRDPELVAEGNHGSGCFLSTALMKLRVKNSQTGLMANTTANSEAMVKLGLNMEAEGLLKKVHVHQTKSRVSSRCVWFEFYDVSDMPDTEKREFATKIRKIGISFADYTTARKSATATAAAGSGDTQQKRYSDWVWPGVCELNGHTGQCASWWCNTNLIAVPCAEPPSMEISAGTAAPPSSPLPSSSLNLGATPTTPPHHIGGK